MAAKRLEEEKRLQFLLAIGLKYAKTAPELSRYYLSNYQRQHKDCKSVSFLRKFCQYCGSLFDGVNSKTRICKKISPKKKDMKKCQNNSKSPTSRQRRKSTISTFCLVCKNTTVTEGSKRTVSHKKEKPLPGTPNTTVGTIQTELPDNYSSLSASAKRKWRNKVRINKLKLQGGNWKPENRTKNESKGTGLLAFLSTLEK